MIDDDDSVRDSLRFLLEVAGHAVTTFASAAEFLASEMHHLACVILDHHMPHMTGLNLAAKLRAEGIGLPILLIIILLITGSLSPDIAARVASLGIERILEKLVNEQDLFDFIDAAMS